MTSSILQYKHLPDDEQTVLKNAFPKYTGGVERVLPHGFVIETGRRSVLERIHRLQVSPLDVWVLTYPRSGTTWIQEMIWNLENGLDFDRAKKLDIDERWFFLDMDFLSSGSHPNAGFVAKAEQSIGEKRLIKSHVPLGLLPANLLSTAKVIYVARNPKDVVVSYFHHHRLTQSSGIAVDFEGFARLFMRGLLIQDPYMTHLKEAWSLRNCPNLHFIWYEDMKKDLPAAIKSVAEFLGKQLTQGEVDLLAQHLDINQMKNNPGVNHQDRHEKGVFLQGENFIRKGVSGGWKKYFSKELDREFDSWIEEETKGTGIEFTWTV